jgi:hypothetical protein
MPPASTPEQFSDRANEHGLVISSEDAADIGGFGSIVDAAYATIREIDTSGFEPAAIFVPTPSKREID